MHYVDLSANPRLPVFLQMSRNLARAANPGEALNAFLDAIHNALGWTRYIHVSCCDLPPGEYRILRHLDYNRNDLIPRGDVPPIDLTRPAYAGGLIGELIATPEPKLVHDVQISEDPVLGDQLRDVRAVGVVPMFAEAREQEWILMLSPEPAGFTPADLEACVIYTNMIASKLTSANLAAQLMEAKSEIDREVRQIAEIQRSLLPTAMPAIPGLQIAASYETFDKAGGDYYDFINYGHEPGGLWGMIIADASGHGPAAAVVMAMVHSLFHSYQGTPKSPVDIMEYINRHLQSERIRHAFVTAFIGLYDARTRTLRYARAGHEPPLLMDTANGARTRRLEDVNGFPLGVADTVGSAEGRVTLAPGQTLVLYTDGITESHSPDGAMFRVEGIEDALVTCNGKSDCVVLVVNDALQEHEAGVRAQDDQTLVAIHVE